MMKMLVDIPLNSVCIVLTLARLARPVDGGGVVWSEK